MVNQFIEESEPDENISYIFKGTFVDLFER